MLNTFARSWSIIALAMAATAIWTIEDRRILCLGILAALFSMWVAGVADGHEHLRRKRPEAFGEPGRQEGAGKE